ncbi:uncharacterized protein FOMMEDRAFT_154606 [Fomitiporia mediterranea MF3/22]|uniref:uncharacterized protein n=1 Tax=Fomitiporia mediterranea (strain MF3/22) TaxID=694068 RepID=UPI0004407C4F|nr:uncharacterized protein FOMMEDRAFT_154606 [Fomitiporia mediterranea MF3/22]EJD03531.1 hypothetical protein FOMMEDRAFT_154606 [Fomitiporia mediterranea MF3/22]
MDAPAFQQRHERQRPQADQSRNGEDQDAPISSMDTSWSKEKEVQRAVELEPRLLFTGESASADGLAAASERAYA